ncbi:MAG: hypothetical protein JSS07_07925 [Proteobacteria bacterium]|nr:hypothetical protein [Pseudomonadota bacterium]
MIQKVSILFFVLLLTGCQQVYQKKSEYFADHSKDYLKSSMVAHLKVPPGLTKPPENETYPMPANIPSPGDLKSVPLEPPGFGKL